MTHSSLIFRETIELNAPRRPKVQAYRLGALAVHRTLGDSSKWTITHLPTGLHFGFYWGLSRLAIAAMTEAHSLTPNWPTIKAWEIEALGPQIYPIMLKHKGRRFSFIPRAIATKDGFNGYKKLD